jgi:MFS family permease
MSRLWDRQLDHYPSTGRRLWNLAIVVLATIVLYYEFYTPGAVAPEILRQFGMSFHFYVYITVAANALGACASVIAGLADRWGRANLVTYGLLVTGLLVLLGIPNATSEWSYAVILCAIGFVEGIILVATPALVRDFSPQLGRASAMGFWTLGPVVASLIVSEVANHTLPHLHAWQDQFIICGFVGIGVFLLALLGLRELTPGLRDQLMVSMRDRALVEARAKGLDVKHLLERPWRQLLKPQIVLGALAISTFLIIYYTAVGFNVVYFQTVFGFSTAQANGIGNWWWSFNAIALVLVGLASDALKVRKPFMVLGWAGTVIVTIIYLGYATHPHTGYYTLAATVSVLSVCMGIAYAPWMAAYTENVERVNPALTATGLAVWGWIIRVVVAVSILVLPSVITSVTPLVEYGSTALKAEAMIKHDPLLNVVIAHEALFTKLAKYSNPSQIPGPLLAQAIKEVGTKELLAVNAHRAEIVPQVAFLHKHQAELLQAQVAAKQTPHQWQDWYWVCVGGEVLFLPLMMLLAGRWSPRAARRDTEEHEQLVARELEALHSD